MTDFNIDNVLGFDSKQLIEIVINLIQTGTQQHSFIDPRMRVWDMQNVGEKIEVTCTEIGVSMIVEHIKDNESSDGGQADQEQKNDGHE